MKNAPEAVHPAEDALAAFGLGKTDEQSSTIIAQHLERCARCRSRVASLSGDSFVERLKSIKSSATTAPSTSSLHTPDPDVSARTPGQGIPQELSNCGQYEAVRELGKGGMGIVYVARNKLLGRDEVLKVVNRSMLDRPGSVERFLREIQSAARLHHPNVVTAYSAFQLGDLLVFAMEFVPGSDLAQVVRNARAPMPIPNACYYVLQAAQGLQHAYEKGMVHRDIKPSNLILTKDGTKSVVKILDFGLSKIGSEKKVETDLTGEGRMLGTPDYMAPEQALDAAKADIRADIYSLGCTLYFLLTGRPPFAASSLLQLLQLHQSAAAPALSQLRQDVPPELAVVTARMIAKEPRMRYQTPGEVAKALLPFVRRSAGAKGSPESSLSGEKQPQQAEPRKNHPDSGPNPFSVLPAAFGRYRVLKLLGQGGMGAVYLADDTQLDRQVALKLPFFNAAESPQRVERFIREARSAAILHHRNICTVYDSGQIDGKPFITIAFIDGAPLDQLLDKEAEMPQRQAADYARKIALALAHAHGKGTVHRDLKPANVMIDVEGEPVVMDFGLAKRASHQEAQEGKLTRRGSVLGTPTYMSPEQVKGETEQIGPATDIYSLGVILFEMLTSQTPYSGSMVEVMGQILAAPTPLAKELRPDVDPRLDDICRKAMAKEPRARFRSMEEFAAALEEFLQPSTAPVEETDVELEVVAPAAPPVESSPFGDLITQTTRPTTRPTASKPAVKKEKKQTSEPKTASGRNWWMYGGIALGIAALVLIGFMAKSVFKVKTPDGVMVLEVSEPNAEVYVDGDRITVTWDGGGKKAEVHVKPGTRKVEVRKDGFKVYGEEVSLEDGGRQIVLARLEKEKPVAPTKSEGPKLAAEAAFVSLFNGKDLGGWIVDGDSKEKDWLIEDGKLALTGGPQETWGFLLSEQEFRSFVLRLQFQQLSYGAKGGVVFRGIPGSRVAGIPFQCKINLEENSNTGAVLWSEKIEYEAPIRPAKLKAAWAWNDLEIELRGQVLKVTLNGECIQSMDLSAFVGKPGSLAGLNRASGRIGLQKHVGNFVFRNIEIKDLTAPPAQLAPGPKHRSIPAAAELEALRRDQLPPAVLALAGNGDAAHAPECLVGCLGDVVPVHPDGVWAVAYSPDNRWLAAGSADRTITLREAATGDIKRVLRGHTNPITALVFSPDGRTLLSCSTDDTIRFWNLDKDEDSTILGPQIGDIWSMAVSPDGRFLAAGAIDRPIKLWKWGEWDKPRELAADKGRVGSLSFSPDGELLASSWDGRVRIYETSTGAVAQAWPEESNWAVAFHKDGKTLVTVGDRIKLWDVAAKKEQGSAEGSGRYARVALHPGGKLMYCWEIDAPRGGLLRDIPSCKPSLDKDGKEIRNNHEPYKIVSAAFSPDGNYLAVGTWFGGVHVWDFSRNQKQLPKMGHTHYIKTLAISPNGRTLLTGGDEGAVIQWDVARPRESRLMQKVSFDLHHVAYSPDGSKYITSTSYNDIVAEMGIVWDAATGKQLFTLNPTVKCIQPVFSPDGRVVAGFNVFNACVHLWDARTGKQLHIFPSFGHCLDAPAFSADGKLLAAASLNTKTVKIWDVESGEEKLSWVDDEMTRIAISPDGRLLAAATARGSINLWDLAAKGVKTRTWSGHTGWIERLKFTPDGKTLISSGQDGTIRLWSPHMARARETISLSPNSSPAPFHTRSLTFELDPSGKYLFAAGSFPVIFILRLPEIAEPRGGGFWDGSNVEQNAGGEKAAKSVQVDIGGGLTMEFILVQPGEFMMGSPADEAGRVGRIDDYEREAQHKVVITKPFYLGKYLVTQEQYEAVTGNNPSFYSGAANRTPQVKGMDTRKFPVECVSWIDAKACCAKLTATNKQKFTFRLPTEAEWEHACRAGAQTPYFWGNDASALNEYAWSHETAEDRTHPVGEKKPNRWGFYDMKGLVWQWCEDYWGPYDLQGRDPIRMEKYNGDDRHSTRGNSFAGDMGLPTFRSACRGANSPGHVLRFDGFRMAMDAPAVDVNKADADRTAAEFVLSIGGTVRVDDEERVIRAAADLPRDGFRLTHVNPSDIVLGDRVSDADLALFSGCRNLKSLNLWGANKVGNAGIAHIAGCKSLEFLKVEGTAVTDLSALSGLQLTTFICKGTAIKDLSPLNGMKLKRLDCTSSQVAILGPFKELTELLSGNCKITDLNPLARMPLEVLECDFDYARDAGIIRSIKTLRRLNRRTPEEVLKEAEAIAALAPDRRAAEYVLSIGGVVRVNDEVDDIKAVADLPKQAFRLTYVNVSRNPKLRNAGLDAFKGCRNLKVLTLDFNDTPIKDVGAANFKDCKNLTSLHISGTEVSDAGLAAFEGCKDLESLLLAAMPTHDDGLIHFKDCKKLKSLVIAGTLVRGPGLASFKGLQRLESLDFRNSSVGDDGLESFADCKNLKRLELQNSAIGDAGLAHFKDCKNLKYLDLSDMRNISDKGLISFKDCKQLETLWIRWNPQIGSAGIAHLKDCKSLAKVVLERTSVSDEGLVAVKGWSNLSHINLGGTKVTPEGIKDLKKALPKCDTNWRP